MEFREMWYDPDFPIDQAAAKSRALEQRDHSVQDDDDDQEADSAHSCKYQVAESNLDAQVTVSL